MQYWQASAQSFIDPRPLVRSPVFEIPCLFALFQVNYNHVYIYLFYFYYLFIYSFSYLNQATLNHHIYIPKECKPSNEI